MRCQKDHRSHWRRCRVLQATRMLGCLGLLWSHISQYAKLSHFWRRCRYLWSIWSLNRLTSIDLVRARFHLSLTNCGTGCQPWARSWSKFEVLSRLALTTMRVASHWDLSRLRHLLTQSVASVSLIRAQLLFGLRRQPLCCPPLIWELIVWSWGLLEVDQNSIFELLPNYWVAFLPTADFVVAEVIERGSHMDLSNWKVF